ncbi:MAG: CPBP family glutamic-type intramembrane protease [Polyangiaceae bacterium]
MTSVRLRSSLFAVSVVAWSGSFVVLARLGTWLTFAVVGLLLVALLVGLRVVRGALLRPNRMTVGVGISSGLLMVVLTHLAYRWLTALAPDIGAATARLMGLLNVSGFSVGSRAALIVLIASCEEVLFRAALPEVETRAPLSLVAFERRDLRRILALAAIYALTTTPLGSPLLAACALLCGAIWGALGVATGSLVAPILAHVVWDLGVLIVWPLLA